MSAALSSLADNLSQIYNKECKGCKERRKIKSECNFSEVKKNKLNYKYKEYKKIWLKPINGLIGKIPNVYFVMKTSIDLFCY